MALNDVRGIGPRSLVLLNKIGITTVDDLVTHYPFRYDILKRGSLTDTVDGDHIIIDGRIESSPILVRFKAGLNKMNFRLVTSSGVVGISIFNRAFLKSHLAVGTGVTVIGKFDKRKNVITASDIKLETLSAKIKIEPVYHLTSGLTNKNMSTYINMALLGNYKEITDFIPLEYQEKYNFVNKRTALNIVHNPPSLEKLEEAKNRLKYEELFSFMFKINYLKIENKNKNSGIKKEIDTKKVEDFIKTLPFELTTDQEKAVSDIVKDLTSEGKMNRLLQGDVGSGKTIVSFLAIYANYLAGYQSALMAPTEILATQHYNNMKDIFKDTDINIALLTGSTSKRDKDKILTSLANNDIDVIIGTHSLIQEEVEYNNLGLVITDEQHRFGVNQRANLENKGKKPDTLYMSATPIPRTYALTIFGDMDVSTIKTRPKGRKKIHTVLKTEAEMKDVLAMMYEELKHDHQIYVIAPLIEESENSDLTNVNELKDKLTVAFGSKYKIGLVHGKMATAAKDKVMNDFLLNKCQILISTTVIEVGVDVPNATMMVIFNADRFGLATLHQLRGRIGRNSLNSYCILIGPKNDRLKVLEESTDGFYITEKDFEMRREGDLFGVRQSGDMAFKIADIKKDFKVLLKAKEDSMIFLEENIRKAFKNNEKYYKIVNEMKSLD